MKITHTNILIITGLLSFGIINNSMAQENTTTKEIKLETVVQVTPTLEIIDQQIGNGAEAIIGSKVVVHYSGWLRDTQAPLQHGKAFDSSLQRGPFTFPLGAGRVIKGWDQGVQGMKIGGKRTLIIPSTLGYGARGAGNGIIPPNADLIFDVELLEVINLVIEPTEKLIEIPQKTLKKIDKKKGKGTIAINGKNVTVHYTGWLFDAKAKNQKGVKFDSSIGKKAFTFSLGSSQVIKAWDEGLLGMQIGGQRTLIIPSSLAYGERGAGNGKIPPNADLIFDIELLQVK
jgi:FKBP-type peptidyl-prolyl cis-trans isomerase